MLSAHAHNLPVRRKCTDAGIWLIPLLRCFRATDGAVIPTDVQTALNAASGFDLVVSSSRSFLVRTTAATVNSGGTGSGESRRRPPEGGRTYAWGQPLTGGEIPLEIQARLDASVGFSDVVATSTTFFVRTVEGEVFTWGSGTAEIPTEARAALEGAEGIEALAATRSGGGGAFFVRPLLLA